MRESHAGIARRPEDTMKESTDDIDKLFAFFEPSAASQYQELGSLDARHDMTERWPLLGAMPLAGTAPPPAPPAEPRDRSVWQSHVPDLPPPSEAPAPAAPPAAEGTGAPAMAPAFASAPPAMPAPASAAPAVSAASTPFAAPAPAPIAAVLAAAAAGTAAIVAAAPASPAPAGRLSGLFSRLAQEDSPVVPEAAAEAAAPPPPPARLDALFRRLDGR
jgi:hypothetical protein